MATQLEKLKKLVDKSDLEAEISKDPKERKQKRVQDILKLLTENITREEFTQSFKKVIEVILKVEKQLQQTQKRNYKKIEI